MKKLKSIRLTLLLILSLLVSNVVSAASGLFIATSEGIRYVYKTDKGITKYVTPQFDSKTGTYYVTDSQNKVVAIQQLGKEANMNQIKIITSNGSKATTQDFMGNDVQILTPMASADPKYQALKTYLETNPSVRDAVAKQIQARNYKIEQIKNDVAEGLKDETLAGWLTNDLNKPMYLEVDDSGAICHDGSGFVLAENGLNGQTTYRDNSYVNRIVISENSEIFNGNVNDPTAGSIISHEIGHMIMDQLYETPNYPLSDFYGPHSKNTISDEGFAISEGWAEALEALSTKDYRAKYGTGDSWRLKTQQNIADNKYIYKDAGVTNITNTAYLKTSAEMLSTEGVNASMFYNLLESKGIQNSYDKICSVFEGTRPQTYRDFVYDFINKYPEDQSKITKLFLEDTKYTTVDPSAAIRYNDLYEAEQAYLNAIDSNDKMTFKLAYESKKQEYDSYNESLFRQACADGTIDSAVEITDKTNSSYRFMRLNESFIKGRRALDTGVQNASNSLKGSFSAKNVAMTAGTSIAINLASQLMNGEKVSLKTAAKSVASMQFVGNFVGSALGAAGGHVVAPVVQAFVPGIVGSLAGALIPTVTSLVGGNLGSSIGAGTGIKAAFKSLDMVAISGQAVGSMVGAMLGSMIPVPVVGTMIGSIVGGIAGEKLFTAVRSFIKKFTNKSKEKIDVAVEVPEAYSPMAESSVSEYGQNNDPMGVRIDYKLDSIKYGSMTSDMKSLKDDYEYTYKVYVTAISTGDAQRATKALEAYQKAKEAYEKALNSLK